MPSPRILETRAKYQEDFIKCVEDVVKVYAGFSIADIYPSIKLLEKISGMRAKVERVHKSYELNAILEHTEKKLSKKEGNENLVDVLLIIQKEGNLEVPLMRDISKLSSWLCMFIQNLNLFALVRVVFRFSSKELCKICLKNLVLCLAASKTGSLWLLSLFRDIFAAESDTSATTVEWAMVELLKNSELMKRAQTEIRETHFMINGMWKNQASPN